MRKLQMFIVTFLVMLAATVGAASAQTMLYADMVWAKPGEDITVPVVMVENPGVAYADLSVTFSNDHVTVLGATKGTVLPGTMITNLTKSGVVLEELTEATVIISGDPGETPANGTLFSLQFHVKESASPGLVPLTISWEAESILNADGEEIEMETQEGGIYVPHKYQLQYYVEDELYTTASVYENEKAQMPEIPKNGEQVFLGWFLENADSAWNFETDIVNRDITLYARWAHQPVEVVASTIYRYNGSVMADVTVKNFSAAENMQLVLGFFAADGRMLGAATEKVSIPVEQSYKLSKTVTVARTAFVKVLAFTALEKLEPIFVSNDRAAQDAAKVSFLTFGGTTIPDIYVTKGSKITMEIPVPEKEGSSFGGWYKNVNETWNFAEDVVSQDVVLQAKWDTATYTVCFMADGKEYDTQTVMYNNKILCPATNPEKDHYLFCFWYETTDENGNPVPFDFEETITRDVTLYAAFEIHAYTVNFITGTDVEIHEQIVDYMNLAEEPVISREHYIFNGWFTEETCENEWIFAEMPVESNMTLYAGWTPETYTIAFETGHGASDVEAQTVSYGEYAEIPVEPEHPYGSFEGWYKDESLHTAFDFSEPIEKSLTLYAKWTYEQVPVYLHNGEAVVETSVLYGEVIPNPGTPETDGNNDFMGWYKEADYQTLWTFETDRVYEETHLFALWELIYFDVTFKTGHGASTVETQSVAYGSVAEEPEAPSHPYGTFEGWYTDDTYTTSFDFTAPIQTTTTVYAKWDYQRVRIIFNNKGKINESSVVYGSLIAEPTEPEAEEGHTFTGWYTDSEKQVLWVFEANRVYEETTLYAGWDVATYTVAFQMNGGTYINPRTVEHGDTLAEPARIPSKVGYEFNGWYTDKETTQRYDFASRVDEDKTLYAGWTDISHLNYIYFDGGNASMTVNNLEADTFSVRAFFVDVTSSTQQTLMQFTHDGNLISLSVVASTQKAYFKLGEKEISFTLPNVVLKRTTEYTLATIDGIHWNVQIDGIEYASLSSDKNEKTEDMTGVLTVAAMNDGTYSMQGYLRTLVIKKDGQKVASFDFRIENTATEIMAEEGDNVLMLDGNYTLDSVNFTGINDMYLPDFAPGFAKDGLWYTWASWCGGFANASYTAFDNVLTVWKGGYAHTIAISMFDQVYKSEAQRNLYIAAEITPQSYNESSKSAALFAGEGNGLYVRDVPAKNLEIYDSVDDPEVTQTYYFGNVAQTESTTFSFGVSTILYCDFKGCSFDLYKPVVLDVDAHGLSGYSTQRLNFLVSGR